MVQSVVAPDGEFNAEQLVSSMMFSVCYCNLLQFLIDICFVTVERS